MDELDRESERLLAAFRDDDEFDDARIAAVGRRLARTTRAAPPSWLNDLDTSQSLTPQPKASGESRRRRAVWWGLGAAAAGLIVAAGVSRVSSLRSDPVPAATAALHQTAVQPRTGHGSPAAVPATPQAHPQPQPAPDQVEVVPPAPVPARGTTAHATQPQRRSTPAAPKARMEARHPDAAVEAAGKTKAAKTASRLTQEVELLDTINRALRLGNSATAALAMERYDRKFSDGQLTNEADGLRRIIACHRGHDGAQAAAQRFLSTQTNSLLHTRLRQACELEKNPHDATDQTPSVQTPHDDNQ